MNWKLFGQFSGPMMAVRRIVAFGLVCSLTTPAGGAAELDAPVLHGITKSHGNVVLIWDSAGAQAGYTVETRESLFGLSQWLPAPASVWPRPGLSWQDPRVANGKAAFYRVAATAGEADRGRLISFEELPALAPADIKAMFAQIGVPLPAGSGVRLVKLVYETVNPFELRTIGSGLVVIPQNPAKPLPLASYQHGTIMARTEVPSAMQGLERVIGVAMGTSGYIAALPDYVGLGDSPGLHPFVHAHSEATAAIDLLRATRAFCATDGVALNGQLFLLGYSEGGHATMALHKELEAGYTNEFAITASAPMAGPYDLSGVMVNDFLSGRAMPNPYYFVYLLAAYQSIYQFAGSLAEILASPYDTLIPPLLDGQHDGGEINRILATGSLTQMLKPEFLAAFKNDPNHPLRLALRENDLYDWTPRAPMKLYHCDGDQDVLFQNSQVAYDSFIRRGATQVEFLIPFPGADHGRCAPIALLAAKLWFDTLLR